MSLTKTGVIMTAEGAQAFYSAMQKGDQAVASFGKSASTASGQVSGFGQIATGALRQLGAIAVSAGLQGVAALGSFVKAGISGAADLQQSVANISTIKPSIDTSAVFSSLNEMQTRVPQTAAQLGDSLYNIFSSIDVSQADALKLTEQFAKGAVGAGTSAETFGTAALGVMNAYKLSTADASHVSDVFFNTINAGVVTGQELASSLGPVTQSATAFGVSLDQLGGLIAGVTKEGGPAAQNINNLNNFLQKISTEKAQGQMAKLGVAVTDSTGAFRPVPAILGDLKARLGDMTEAERANALQTIFPDAQARQGAQTLISQLDFVNSAIETNQSTTGSATSAYEKMSATFQSQSLLAKNAIMGFAMTLGAAALPALTGFVSQIGPAVQWLQNFASVLLSSEHPLATLSAVIDGVLPGFSSFASFVGANLTPILIGLGAALASVVVPALASAAGVAASAVVAFLPVIAPIVAIGAAAAALYVAWSTNFLGIQTTLTAVWGTIQPIFTSFGTVIGTLTTLASSVATAFGEGGIGAAFTTLTAGLPTVTAAFSTWATNAGTILLGLGEQFLNWVTPLIPGVVAKLGEFGASIVSWIGAQASTWGAQLLTWGEALVSWVSPYIGQALAALGEFAAAAWAWVQQQAPTWLANLEAWGVELYSWVQPQVATLLGKLGELASSAWSWVVAQAPVLLSKLETWGQSMVNWVQPQIAPLLAQAGALGSSFIGWISAQAAPIVSALVAWGSSLVAWIPGATVDFLSKWPGMLNQFLDWIGGAAGPLLLKLGDWALKFVEWIAPMIPGFLVALGGIALALTTFVAETAVILLAKLDEWGRAMGSWITTTAIPELGKAWTAFTASLNGLLDQGNAWLRTKAAELGHAIIAGISAGLDNAAGALFTKLNSLAASALSGMKAALGIHSPSQVFADEVGRPIVDGIALGITKGQGAVTDALLQAINTARTSAIGDLGKLASDEASFQTAREKAAADHKAALVGIAHTLSATLATDQSKFEVAQAASAVAFDAAREKAAATHAQRLAAIDRQLNGTLTDAQRAKLQTRRADLESQYKQQESAAQAAYARQQEAASAAYAKQTAQQQQQAGTQRTTLQQQYTEQEKAAALAYAQQEAQQRQHLGQMLIDLVTSWAQMGKVAPERAADMAGAIAKEYGVQQSLGERTFGAQAKTLEDWATNTGVSSAMVIAALTGTEQTAASTQKQIDALTKQFTDNLTASFNAGTITAGQLAVALSQIPSKVQAAIAPGGRVNWLDTINAAVKQTQDETTKQAEAIKTNVSTSMTGLAANVKTTFGGILADSTQKWGQIHLGITDQIGATKTGVGLTTAAMKTAASMAWGQIGADASTGWSTVKTNITTPIGAAQAAVGLASGAMQESMKIPPETQDAIFETYRHVTDRIIEQLEKVTTQINNVTEALGRLSRAKTPQGPGGSAPPPAGPGTGIPGQSAPPGGSRDWGGARALGGPVMAGMAYTVGEHGRERFVPNVNGYILDAATTQRISPPASAQQIAHSAIYNSTTYGPTFQIQAQYKYQSERSLRQDIRMLQLVYPST